jgi:N-acetylneuraminic acid mutarotase
VLGAHKKEMVFGTAELLNPSTLTWASTGSMTVPLVGGTVTVLSNGQVLFAGGTGNNSSDTGGLAVASAELYTP